MYEKSRKTLGFVGVRIECGLLTNEVIICVCVCVCLEIWREKHIFIVMPSTRTIFPRSMWMLFIYNFIEVMPIVENAE